LASCCCCCRSRSWIADSIGTHASQQPALRQLWVQLGRVEAIKWVACHLAGAGNADKPQLLQACPLLQTEVLLLLCRRSRGHRGRADVGSSATELLPQPSCKGTLGLGEKVSEPILHRAPACSAVATGACWVQAPALLD
jgi:hypothetical protein